MPAHQRTRRGGHRGRISRRAAFLLFLIPLSWAAACDGGGSTPGARGPGEPAPDAAIEGPAGSGGLDAAVPGLDAGPEAAEGSADASGADAEAGVAGSSFDLPTVRNLGGPILRAPRVQPLYDPGFVYRSEMDDFLAKLARSTYWPAVVGEYGVGALTISPGETSAAPAPAQIGAGDLPTLIQQALLAHPATLGPARVDTIYILFLSAASTLSVNGLAFCAADAPSAMHTEVTVAGTTVALVVIPTCATFAGDAALTGPRALSPALSHELVEAATDPFPTSAPAFAEVDEAHVMWGIAMNGGEVADLCENEAPNLVSPDDIGLPVQRIWSNRRAASGTSGPCLPVPAGEGYFVADGRLPDQLQVQIEAEGAVTTIPGLLVSAGQPATLTVDYRGEPTAPASWQVVAAEFHGGASLRATLAGMRAAAGSGGRGDRQSITVLTSSSTATGAFPVLVLSHSAAGALHLWVGAMARQ